MGGPYNRFPELIIILGLTNFAMLFVLVQIPTLTTATWRLQTVVM